MIVYWTPFSADTIDKTGYNFYSVIPFINFYEPIRLLKQIGKKDNIIRNEKGDLNFFLCPSFTDNLKNVFIIKFPVDYNLKIYEDSIKTDFYDQDFFDKFVVIRSLKQRLLSIYFRYLFFSEYPLKIETTSCHFSDNDFVNKTFMVPGEYDIGRWCRPLESAFLIKKDVGKINIHRGDDFLYVKFHTDENIQLKKFFYTKELDEIVTSCISSRMFKGNCDGSRKDMPLE